MARPSTWATRTKPVASAALLGTALSVLSGAGLAAAADDFVVPLATVTGSPGSVLSIADMPVDASLIGRSCTATYEADNNTSVHPGTDLLVSSGGQQIVLTDVEAAPGAATVTSAELVLGPSLAVAVRLGSDGIASLSAALSIRCSTVTTGPPTTIPPTTVPPTTAPPTSTQPTSTTTPPSATATTATTSPPPASDGPTSTVAVGPVSTTATTTVGAAGPVTTDTSPPAAQPAPSAAPVTTGPRPRGQLPATGSEPAWWIAIAGALVAAGVLTRRAARAAD